MTDKYYYNTDSFSYKYRVAIVIVYVLLIAAYLIVLAHSYHPSSIVELVLFGVAACVASIVKASQLNKIVMRQTEEVFHIKDTGYSRAVLIASTIWYYVNFGVLALVVAGVPNVWNKFNSIVPYDITRDLICVILGASIYIIGSLLIKQVANIFNIHPDNVSDKGELRNWYNNDPELFETDIAYLLVTGFIIVMCK